MTLWRICYGVFELALSITIGTIACAWAIVRGRSLKKALLTLQGEKEDAQSTITTLKQDLHHLCIEKERITIAYEKDREFWETQRSTLQNTEKKWQETFENITQKMLRTSEQTLTKSTEASLENFRKHLHTSMTGQDNAFHKLERSLKDGIVALSTHVDTLSKDHTLLGQTLQKHKDLFVNAQDSFQAQTDKILHALKTPQVRGQWGEIQLKRIIELAGMEPYCDFSEQSTHTNDDTTIRPDVIINLPEKKHIIIDAKAPLGQYLEALESSQASERRKKMALHAKQIWSHVTTLSSKRYWSHFNSPDFVILFLPGDPFLSTALEQDPSLLERAATASVLIATPTTLMALLKAVHYGWRNLHITENIRHILEVSGTLLQRASTFQEHFTKIGKSLEATTNHFNKAVGSFETRLLPSAEKLQKLGITANQHTLDVADVYVKQRTTKNSKPIA